MAFLGNTQNFEEIRRPAGVSDWKVLFLFLFLACTCSFVLLLRVSASSESRSRPSLEVKLPTIWTDEKQSREEAERRERLEERRVEEKE